MFSNKQVRKVFWASQCIAYGISSLLVVMYSAFATDFFQQPITASNPTELGNALGMIFLSCFFLCLVSIFLQTYSTNI